MIHCLQSKQFYPIFGKGLGTKAFWIFTFAFFNPILSLLYIVCVFGPFVINAKYKKITQDNTSENTENIQRRKYVSAIVFAFTCIIIVLFEIPRTSNRVRPDTIINKTQRSESVVSNFLKSGLNLGFINAKNKIQTISSGPSNSDVQVNISNIVLVCKNEDILLRLIARNIQKTLSELPYISSVSCYSKNKIPEPKEEKKELFISLEIPEKEENKFLLNRKLDIKINCAASGSISNILSDTDKYTSNEDNNSFIIQSNLLHASETLCIECPGTEYEHEVKNISQVLTEAFTKQFENLMKDDKDTSEILVGANTE